MKKIVIVVSYRFAHGFNFKHMWNRFDVDASTIRTYIELNYVILYDKNKLLNKADKHTF
jgi:hypothetical protein